MLGELASAKAASLRRTKTKPAEKRKSQPSVLAPPSGVQRTSVPFRDGAVLAYKRLCEPSELRYRHKACRRVGPAARPLQQQSDREVVRVGLFLRVLSQLQCIHLQRRQTPVRHQKTELGSSYWAARACCVLRGCPGSRRRHRQLRSKASATSGPIIQRFRRSDLSEQGDCRPEEEHAPRRRLEQLRLSTSEGERARQTCRPGRVKVVVSLDTIKVYQHRYMSARVPRVKRTHPCHDSARQRARRVAFPVHQPRCARTPASAAIILMGVTSDSLCR